MPSRPPTNAPIMPLDRGVGESWLDNANFGAALQQLGQESVVAIPPGLPMATGQNLDQLAEAVYGITRNMGEPDESFRTRVQGRQHNLYQYDSLELTVGGQKFTQRNINFGPPETPYKKKSVYEWLRENPYKE